MGRWKKRADDRAVPALDARFLAAPGLALEQCRTAAKDMAESAKEALALAISLIDHYEEERAVKVAKLEGTVDSYEDQLGTYLVKLGSRDLSGKDSHTLTLLLHDIGDFERISDHALNIQEAARELERKGLRFSKEALAELGVFTDAVEEIVDISFRVFQEGNMVLAKKVEPLEEVIDLLNAEMKKRHIKRLRKGECTIEMGFILADITTDLERVADHCSNIAVSLLEIGEDELGTHEYLDSLKGAEHPEFGRAVEEFRGKYRLPNP